MRLIFANFTNPKISKLDTAAIPLIRGIKTVSRLSYKPDTLPFKLTSEYIPDLITQSTHGTLSWDQCCEKRIAEFEKTKGRIYIMWSGGIDSTALLVSVMKYGTQSLKAKITIVLSTESFREFPEMFKLICSQFPLLNVYYPPESYLKKEDLLVTGELGDQLFGSDFIYSLANYSGEKAIFDSFSNQVPKLFEKMAGKENGKAIYERLEPITKESPFPIRTSFDYFWWWNFSQKWQHVKYRVLFMNFSKPFDFKNNVACFFDTPDFQHWSMANHSKKINNDLSSYKHTAKNFITEFTGFTSYLSKPKVGSLKNIRMLRPLKWGLLENFSLCEKEYLITLSSE